MRTNGGTNQHAIRINVGQKTVGVDNIVIDSNVIEGGGNSSGGLIPRAISVQNANSFDSVVISNNSTDKTELNAKNAGATVLTETKKGYGYACLKGLDYISKQKTKPDIIVFLDGDYSDYPEQLTEIIAPIINKDIDFVLGARVKKLRESGSMTPQQVFGNWLATFLMKLFFGAKFYWVSSLWFSILL